MRVTLENNCVVFDGRTLAPSDYENVELWNSVATAAAEQFAALIGQSDRRAAMHLLRTAGDAIRNLRHDATLRMLVEGALAGDSGERRRWQGVIEGYSRQIVALEGARVLFAICPKIADALSFIIPAAAVAAGGSVGEAGELGASDADIQSRLDEVEREEAQHFSPLNDTGEVDNVDTQESAE